MPFNEHFLNTATKITSVETRNIQEHFIEFMDTLQAVESPTGKTPPLTLKVLHSVRFQVSWGTYDVTHEHQLALI